MKTSTWLRWLLAVMAIAALALFAACGDDDDDDPNDSGDDSSNNDDRDDDDNSGGGGSDEEEYVADLCGAIGDFGDALTQIISDPENQDASEDDALDLFEEPFEALLNTLQDADPPGDVNEFHDALVENLEDTLDKIRDGDTEALEEVGAVELPTPSAEVEAKYAAIAENNPECAAANLFGE
ncbi:MAG: hypothetical protein WD557_09140 [Dehalococcoidia bacterium]